MHKIYNGFKDRDFVVLAINVSEKKEKVIEYVKKQKVPFPVLLDADGKVAAEYGVRGYPAHYLINRQGKVLAIGFGAKNWERKESKNLIRHLVGKEK